MRTLCLLLLALASDVCSAAPGFVYSPYKDLAIWRDGGDAITYAHHGKALPYIANGKAAFGSRALTWAFATGECGDETWAGRTGEQVARANVAAFDQAGVSYIVSTGGEGGIFTCSSDEGMERFLARYASPHLIGFDFDIEAGQTPQQVASLIARIKTAQQRHPQLRMSFTVATRAASDGSLDSLNAQGETILRALGAAGVTDFVLNLMVMDYGPPAPANCVVRKQACDMAASALQALRNVHTKYGVPMARMELTAMIGVNDVAANEVSVADASRLAQAARKLGLAGLHFWSLDRDTPCAQPAKGASSTCSGMAVPAGAYGRALAR